MALPAADNELAPHRIAAQFHRERLSDDRRDSEEPETPILPMCLRAHVNLFLAGVSTSPRVGQPDLTATQGDRAGGVETETPPPKHVPSRDERGNLHVAEAMAREIGRVDLLEALELVVLISVREENMRAHAGRARKERRPPRRAGEASRRPVSSTVKALSAETRHRRERRGVLSHWSSRHGGRLLEYTACRSDWARRRMSQDIGEFGWGTASKQRWPGYDPGRTSPLS
jgi:hypothetical protein